MKYYLQLIKSYLRLHEQGSSPEQEAQKLIGDTERSNPGTPIPVNSNGSIFLQLGKPITDASGGVIPGNVTLYGLPGANLVVQYGKDKSKGKGYPKLLKLLSGEQQQPSPGEPPKDEATANQGALAQGGQIPPDQTQDIEIINGARFSKLIQEICASKNKKEDKAMCNYLALNMHKLTNSRTVAMEVGIR